MPKKHIKLSRQPSMKYERNWAEDYGRDIWWKSLPQGAINHADLCWLARDIIKGNVTSKQLWCVREGGSIQKYIIGLTSIHLLTVLDLVFFDNYWMAVGFSTRIKKQAPYSTN